MFCITVTRDPTSFKFFDSIHVHSWPSDAMHIGSGRYLVAGQAMKFQVYQDEAGRGHDTHAFHRVTESDTIGGEGPWNMVVCIGRDGSLRSCRSSSHMVHIMLPHDVISRGQLIGDINWDPAGFTAQAFSSGKVSHCPLPATNCC
jgi:hypothetical protein